MTVFSAWYSGQDASGRMILTEEFKAAIARCYANEDSGARVQRCSLGDAAPPAPEESSRDALYRLMEARATARRGQPAAPMSSTSTSGLCVIKRESWRRDRNSPHATDAEVDRMVALEHAIASRHGKDARGTK
jgi:hypothetical protein